MKKRLMIMLLITVAMLCLFGGCKKKQKEIESSPYSGRYYGDLVYTGNGSIKMTSMYQGECYVDLFDDRSCEMHLGDSVFEMKWEVEVLKKDNGDDNPIVRMFKSGKKVYYGPIGDGAMNLNDGTYQYRFYTEGTMTAEESEAEQELKFKEEFEQLKEQHLEERAEELENGHFESVKVVVDAPSSWNSPYPDNGPGAIERGFSVRLVKGHPETNQEADKCAEISFSVYDTEPGAMESAYDIEKEYSFSSGSRMWTGFCGYLKAPTAEQLNEYAMTHPDHYDQIPNNTVDPENHPSEEKAEPDLWLFLNCQTEEGYYISVCGIMKKEYSTYEANDDDVMQMLESVRKR